jgi:hypothetical protein
MALGPGKYDGACTVARDLTGGGVILIVVDGHRGAGFSAQLLPYQLTRMPVLLRALADQIEADAHAAPHGGSNGT